nr:hypothetical protein [Candidatus Ichthyocystis hellenicum]
MSVIRAKLRNCSVMYSGICPAIDGPISQFPLSSRPLPSAPWH